MNKYLHTDSTSYCLGMSLTIEALKYRHQDVNKIVLSLKAHNNEQLDYLLKLAKDYNVEVVYDDKIIDFYSLKENCYCIGFFNKFYKELNTNKHIVLYRFNDFGELGTVLRSAISFDFKDIVLIDNHLDYFDPRCIRASMGAIFSCNIKSFDSIDDYLKVYPKQHLYAFSSKGHKEISNLKLGKHFSLVFGQTDEDINNNFDEIYYLKHHGDKELSLSIKSSIALQKAFSLLIKS